MNLFNCWRLKRKEKRPEQETTHQAVEQEVFRIDDNKELTFNDWDEWLTSVFK